jgi:hypothetical protein
MLDVKSKKQQTVTACVYDKLNENFAIVGCEKYRHITKNIHIIILVTSECDQAHDMDVRWIGTRLPWISSVCTSCISSMLGFISANVLKLYNFLQL